MRAIAHFAVDFARIANFGIPAPAPPRYPGL